MNDVIFLHPEYRKGENAIGLFKTVEKELKKRHVTMHTFHMKVQFPFESLAEYLGYEKIEYNYRKILGA